MCRHVGCGPPGTEGGSEGPCRGGLRCDLGVRFYNKRFALVHATVGKLSHVGFKEVCPAALWRKEESRN